MPRFFRRFAEGVFDEADIIARSAELAEFVVQAAGHYGFDPKRVMAAGFSNGANIGVSTLLLHPGLLLGGVLFRAMVPLEPATPPALSGTRVWLGAGRRDPIVPQENVQRLAALLQSAGADVTLEWRDAGHDLGSEEVAAAGRWLATGPPVS